MLRSLPSNIALHRSIARQGNHLRSGQAIRSASQRSHICRTHVLQPSATRFLSSSSSVSQKQHKALFLESKFGKFALGKAETPKPGPGQLLVKIEAAGLNPVDWKIQTFGVFVEEFPAIIGTDIAGVVEEVGEGVTKFAKGDRVVYQGAWSHDKAGFQLYNLADVETTAKIPAHISFEQAASIPVCIAAAVVGLYNGKPNGGGLPVPFEASSRGKNSGQALVVLGGATSVGQYVIQLAKLSGFSPIIATASPKHEAYLKSLGATHVLDRHLPLASLPDAIKKITPLPIKTTFDAVSSLETQQAGYDLLAEGGQLNAILSADIKKTEGKEVAQILGIWSLPHTRELGIKLYSKLTELLEEGAIKPTRVEIVPNGLDGVVGGLERLKSDQVSGFKLVIRPQETA